MTAVHSDETGRYVTFEGTRYHAPTLPDEGTDVQLGTYSQYAAGDEQGRCVNGLNATWWSSTETGSEMQSVGLGLLAATMPDVPVSPEGTIEVYGMTFTGAIGPMHNRTSFPSRPVPVVETDDDGMYMQIGPHRLRHPDMQRYLEANYEGATCGDVRERFVEADERGTYVEGTYGLIYRPSAIMAGHMPPVGTHVLFYGMPDESRADDDWGPPYSGVICYHADLIRVRTDV